MAKMKVKDPVVSGNGSGVNEMTKAQRKERLAFLLDKRETLVDRLAKVESEIKELK